MDLSFTNKIKFIFNKNEKINADFDFYKFQNEKGYFENNFLKNNNSLDILSVVYTFGNTWYMMLKKDTDIFELKKNLSDNIQCEKILYEQIPYENIKYQILLNYIPKISKNSDISNALGKLYYYVKQDGKCVRLINFEINYQNILTFKIKSFYPVSKDYKITKSTIFIHSISKKVFDKNIENSLEYHEKSPKKASVQFLSIENLEKFKKSKCYFLKRLLDDIQKHLKDYLEFEFLPYENWENKNLNKEFKDYEKIKNYKSDEVKTLFKNFKLIINNLENEAAKELENKLKEDLLKLFNPNAKKILELNIIYSKEHYENEKLNDKYKAKIHTQHICIDEINEKNYNNTLAKIIQELLIKKDLIEKRINLVNEKQDMEIIYIHKENKEISFHSMLIYKNMKFDFLGTDKQVQESLEAFIRSNIKYPDKPKLAIRVGDKLSLISKTELKILPDIKNIYEKLSSDTKCIKKPVLKDLFNELKAKEELIKWLDEQKYEIPIKDIKKGIKNTLGINHASKEYKDIEQLFLNKGITLETHLRDTSSKGLYNGNHHFFTFKLDGILYYSVGKSANLDSNFNNTANCYRLDGLNGSLLGILEPISIDLIAKMCSINYVRNHQNSVLPWANKYLKEYLKANGLI